jgi:CheY-like chemotaxis protein
MLGASGVVEPRAGGTHGIVFGSGDKAHCGLLRATLSDQTVRIDEADSEDGVVALVGVHRPSLVVLDLELAQGNGIEACRRIKELGGLSAPFVILISGRVEPQIAHLAREAGADAYLTKPWRPLHVLMLAAQARGVASPRAIQALRLRLDAAG